MVDSRMGNKAALEDGKKTARLRKKNGRIVMGGDNNASEIALIPLEDIANAF